MHIDSDELFAVVVKAFGLALVACLGRFWFFCSRFVIGFGPVVAIRAEMPGGPVAFASICHLECGQSSSREL